MRSFPSAHSMKMSPGWRINWCLLDLCSKVETTIVTLGIQMAV